LILEPPQSEPGCRCSSVKLRLLDPLQVEHWDELLQTHPGATIFHSQGWARVLATTYGYRPLYLAAADSQRLWALLPLFEVRSWITGKRGVGIPFSDSCPPLLSGEFDLPTLFSAARDLGSTRGWKSLELRGVPEGFAAPSISYYEHDLDLNPAESTLLENCDSAMRRSIRKAQRAEVQVELSSSREAVERYYGLHQLTRQKHGTPPQPISFFRNIQKFILEPGHGVVLLARIDHRPVAGAVFFRFGAHSAYKFGASDETAQEHRPNNLLLWSGVARMKELGAKVLSFGRTSLHQDGLRRFKRSFGARESLLRYIKYDYRSGAFGQERDDGSTGFHTLLFRYCPKPVSRALGAALYPHVG
jgi:CelD/BcsL family acetyltransferase involved in cellulose biosynthesis